MSMFFTTFIAHAEKYDEIIEVLKYVETNNQPHLIGDGGDSYGVLQIQWPAIRDVNKYFGTHFTHEDAFNPQCAVRITRLYMQMGAELYCKKYGKEAPEEALVRNHNGGIYRGYRIRATIPYWERYKSFKRKFNNKDRNVNKM